MFVYVLYTLFL